jgi:hypothetical protein
MMVARTHPHPYGGLVIIFERDSQPTERLVARDGERACYMASLLIAELRTLQAGDRLTVEEA